MILCTNMKSSKRSCLPLNAALLGVSLALPINVLAQLSNQAHFLRNRQPSELPKSKALFQEDDESDIRRVQLQYKDLDGEVLAESCADMVIDSPFGTSIIVIEARLECLEALEAAGQLEYADIDFPTEVVDVVTSEHEHGSERYLTTSKEHSDRLLRNILPKGLEMIQADQLDVGSHEVVVCVCDTGIAINHPDFQGANITGEDAVFFYGERWKWNIDMDGHGTHVAGILAAKSNNGVGIQGAGNIRLHIVRALNDFGEGSDSDIRNAINQCVAAGAKIINLSLGTPYLSYFTDALLREVRAKGILIFAPSGNDGTNAAVYPASHSSVISVTALQDNGSSRHYKSNTGIQVELGAPGMNILSTSVSRDAVTTSSFSYPAIHIGNPAVPSLTRVLVDCGDGSGRKCTGARGKICLMQVIDSAPNNIRRMYRVCERGGGIGAVIFGGGVDPGTDNRYDQPTSLSLVVHVGHTVGFNLLNSNVLEVVTIGDRGGNGFEETYGILSGSSLASAHAAAAAALVWSHFGGECSSEQIRYALAYTAKHPSSEVTCNQQVGYGLVQTKDAYDWLRANNCTTWQPPTTSQGGCSTA